MASDNVKMIATATNEGDNMMIDENMLINSRIKSAKEHFSTTKQYYQSLARSIVVYGRERTDCDESIVVRDVYPDTKFNGFGVSGIEYIETLFNAIIKLICGQVDAAL